jgi:hypothetical protein
MREKCEYPLIPVFDDASIRHIATVAMMSVRAPKPFANPKNTWR